MHGVKLKKMKTALGGATETEVFLSQTTMGSPPSASTSKLMGYNFLDDPFNPDLDLKMVEDIGAGFVDSLGDASMDCFTDLRGMLMEPGFVAQPESKGDNATLNFLNLDAAMKPQPHSQKRSFAEMEDPPDSQQCSFAEVEDPPSDLAKLSANVGLTRSRTPSLDHDYSSRPKCARLSPAPASVESAEEPFLVPDVSPASSPSSYSSVSAEERRKQRREKNNMASKRSREIRKNKYRNMETEAERLYKENARLERRVLDLEKLAKDMKEILVTKLKLKT